MTSRSNPRNSNQWRWVQRRAVGAMRFALPAALFSVAAFAQCTYTVTAPNSFGGTLYVDASQQTLTIQITASSQSCQWTAASNGFATLSGASSGTGNGSVSYSIAANPTTTYTDRTVTLQIAGLAVPLIQRGTTTTFSDVNPPDYDFNGANVLSKTGVTAGCAAAVPPNLPQYCPNANVTRGEMAAFLVRMVNSGGSADNAANVNNFLYSTTPYFTDVLAGPVNLADGSPNPNYSRFFKFVQKMRDLAITAGTTATLFSPNLNVTRGQMAKFIVLARLGATSTFTYNPTPYFTDEPANDIFFRFVQKLKEIGITSGCTVDTYCPNEYVTRGQMAIFLVRSGFNDLLSVTAPIISSVSPNSGKPGNSVTVALTGLNTHFVQGSTTVTAGGGVTAGTATVTDATHLTVDLTIPPGAVQGQISITAQTPLVSAPNGLEDATNPNGFIIGLGDPVPTISGFMPSSGPIGTSVTLTGTGLVSSDGAPADVRMAVPGGGLASAPVTAATATSLTFVVPSTAGTGNITISASSGSVTSTTPFTVTPSSTFTLSAGPSPASIIAGEMTTYTVTLGSTNGFTALANLSVTGVPSGITATFNPTQITAGGQSTLTLTAPSTQATTSATLVITAAATVDGIAESLSTDVGLNVQPITTSFIGRTVVDDTTNTSIAGVTVSMVGLDGSGHKTACTGSTISDASGNFALTNLSSACIGPQLVGFVGTTVTSPPGAYAGLQLVFTLVSNTVVASPVLVHLPRVDNVETFNVIQNDTVDQTYAFSSIPGLSVTVYAGTVLSEQDGSQPNPFPLAAVQVPVDRLPDIMPPTTASVAAFIVAFQPAEAVATKAVAVWFPNTLNTAPGTNVPLMTLDPTLGRMVPYGTGTVSSDGTTIIPDIDPSTGGLQHRYGIVHFDWHGPATNPPPIVSPVPDPVGPKKGDPVDLGTGLTALSVQDLNVSGNRGSVTFTRIYRGGSTQLQAFGIGSSHEYDYRLDTLTPQSVASFNLVLPTATRIPFVRRSDGTLTNSTVPMVAGAVITPFGDGSAILRWKNGDFFKFVPGNFLSNSVLVQKGDPNGNIVNIVRNPSDPRQITEIDDPAGRKLKITWNSTPVITSITDPIGRTVSYAYDGADRLISFTSTLGGVTHYEYDSKNNMTRITDPRGIVASQSTFDADNRVIGQIDSNGGKWTFAYTLANALVPTSPVIETRVTDPLGNVTIYRFSTQGYLLGVTDATGQVRTMTRQSGTNFLLSLTGPGTCETCGLTAAGDVFFTYDTRGNLLTRTDALGDTTTYTYDPVFSRVTSATDAVGDTSVLAYDANGNVIGVTDARGNVSTFTRGAYGLLTQTQDAAGNKTTYTYDSVGNVTEAADALGQITRYSYDAVSRLVAALDPLGEQTSYTYNGFDELLSWIEPNGRETKQTFDLSGYMTSWSDAKGGTVTFTYDAAGRPIVRTDQLNSTTTYTYDNDNNVVSLVNRRGQTATFAYDALNRVVREQYVDATITHTYDAYGRLVQLNDSQGGIFSSAFDLAGRVLQSVGPFGAIAYTRDGLGRVVTRTVTGQPTVTYQYDADSNLTQAAMAGATINRTYDARNILTGMARSNGVNGAYFYDALGRLLTITETGNATTLVSRGVGYDAADRVVSMAREDGQPLVTPSATGVYNEANEIASYGGTTYTHDADGNRLKEVSAAGTTTYTWDARGRLQAILAPGGITTSFLYDYDGNMIRKRVTSTGSDVVERYVLDDLRNVVSIERVNAGVTSILTGRKVDQHWAAVSGGSAVFALSDNLMSTVALTDSTGAVTGRAYYEPYGHTTETGAAYPVEFTGRTRVGPDLYYLRARFLDTNSGRFLSEDPLGIYGGSADLYTYANNNPTSYLDPFGLKIVVNGDPHDYQVAIGYLEKDPGMKKIIQDLENSDTTYYVNYINNDNDKFSPSSNTVSWDPKSALKDKGQTQTPALGLGHELDHAHGKDDNPGEYAKRRGVPDPNYNNKEERRVIQGSETDAAHTLGEGTRTDHGGTPYKPAGAGPLVR